MAFPAPAHNDDGAKPVSYQFVRAAQPLGGRDRPARRAPGRYE